MRRSIGQWAARSIAPAIFVASTVLVLWRLGEPGWPRSDGPPRYVYDEAFYAFAAHRETLGDPARWQPRASRAEILRSGTDDVTLHSRYQWEHPPGATLIMAGSIRMFGWSAFAARLSSVIFGLATLILTWRLARRLRPESSALVALALVATDGVLFTFSRTAMPNIHLVCFTLAAAMAAYRFWIGPVQRRRWLVACGAALGAGIATKWTIAPLALGLAVATAGRIVHDAWRLRTAGSHGRMWIGDAVAWLVSFAVVPLAIYFAAYLPYFAAGHDLGDFARLQREMWTFHHHMPDHYMGSSPWYTWPFARPVPFLDGVTDGGRSIVEISCRGNPLLWWMFVPALVASAVRFVRRRRPADALVVCGFCAAWLPWAFVDRYGFAYYLAPAVPFGAIAVAHLLDDVRRLAPRAGGVVCGAYLAACIAAFLALYPAASGLPRSRHDAAIHADR